MEIGATSSSYLGINKQLNNQLDNNRTDELGSFKDILKEAKLGKAIEKKLINRDLDSAKIDDKVSSGIDKKLMDVCYEFESILVNRVFKVMRDSVETKSSFLHGGYAEDIFKDMLYDKYSSRVARSESFGLAKNIYNQLVSKRSDIKAAK